MSIRINLAFVSCDLTLEFLELVVLLSCGFLTIHDLSLSVVKLVLDLIHVDCCFLREHGEISYSISNLAFHATCGALDSSLLFNLSFEPLGAENIALCVL